MANTPKDILAIVASADQEAALSAAEALGARWDAHVAVLLLTELPTFVGAEANFSADLWAQMVTQTRAAAAIEREKIQKRMASLAKPFELREAEVTVNSAERIAALHAMHADLTILERAEGPLCDAAFDGALFNSGKPLLYAPPTWRGGALGRRVIVGWAPKREAARALGDAAPFLESAEKVRVVTVDAAPEYGSSAPPGLDVSAHLARHGLDVELRQVDGMGREPADALIDEARALEADMIVMGGYGHSRLREFVFGGVTRAMKRKCPLPVLMSH
jgi:nucleotide-binding universal stress UspA family protein